MSWIIVKKAIFEGEIIDRPKYDTPNTSNIKFNTYSGLHHNGLGIYCNSSAQPWRIKRV